MPRRTPLPSSLPQVFSAAEAFRAGVAPSRLRSGDLTRPHHGVRRRGAASAAVLDALRDYAPLLRRGDRFSHASAALLWGAPLPKARSPVHVTATSAQRPRSAGVVGHEGAGSCVLRHGLPASDPPTLFLELAGLLDLDDLVAIGDHLVLDPYLLDPADPRPWTTPAALRATADGFRGRGARHARAAAELVRIGAESRPETLLRLLLVRAGCPEPQSNVEIRDRGGRTVGRFDLAWPERRVACEYDGDQHRLSTAQYEKDIRRYDRATEAGWTVIRVRSHGLFRDPAETAGRVRRALGI